MIRIQSLTKRYQARAALADVSLQFEPGEVTLLLGANGAGKSTLLRCLLGVTSFEGSIRVCGLDPLADGRSVRALVGYMPQSGGLHQDVTVAATLDFYADIRRVPRERCAVLLQEAGLREHAAARVAELSGGLRQRLGFALAMLADPRILVLDEPTSSLDAASRDWLAGRLRAAAEQGRTVIVSTHAGQELFAAGDRRIVLEDGRVVSDTRTSERRERPTGQAAPPAVGSIAPLIAKEIKDGVQNRWLVTYAVLLGVLGLMAAATGIDGTSGLGLQAFGRTTATLMNLCLLLAPLVAVVLAGSSIAGERERGTLEHLLAQPISRSGLLLAKHAALLASLSAATVAGFVPAGLLIAWHAGPQALGHYLLFPLIAILAGATMAAVGLLLSVWSRSGVQAQGAAVFTWFAFVLLYDLVLMGSLAFAGIPVEALSFSLAANPVDAARVLAVLSLEPDLYLLGPAGAYLTAQLSRSGAALVLLASLAVWATLPVALALARFSVRRPRNSVSRRQEAPVSCLAD